MDHTYFGVWHLPITRNYQAPVISRNSLLVSMDQLHCIYFCSKQYLLCQSFIPIWKLTQILPSPFSRSSSSIKFNSSSVIPLALLCNPNFNFILTSCQRHREPTPQGSQTPQSTAAQHYMTANLSKERKGSIKPHQRPSTSKCRFIHQLYHVQAWTLS